MLLSQPRYSADETVQRTEDLYERQIRSQVEGQYQGQYIAIDIDTGDYEIGTDYHLAAHTLLSRRPGGSVGVLRIGFPAVGRIGGRVKAAQS